jgi:hypothetical protein
MQFLNVDPEELMGIIQDHTYSFKQHLKSILKTKEINVPCINIRFRLTDMLIARLWVNIYDRMDHVVLFDIFERLAHQKLDALETVNTIKNVLYLHDFDEDLCSVLALVIFKGLNDSGFFDIINYVPIS